MDPLLGPANDTGVTVCHGCGRRLDPQDRVGGRGHATDCPGTCIRPGCPYHPTSASEHEDGDPEAVAPTTLERLREAADRDVTLVLDELEWRRRQVMALQTIAQARHGVPLTPGERAVLAGLGVGVPAEPADLPRDPTLWERRLAEAGTVDEVRAVGAELLAATQEAIATASRAAASLRSDLDAANAHQRETAGRTRLDAIRVFARRQAEHFEEVGSGEARAWRQVEELAIPDDGDLVAQRNEIRLQRAHQRVDAGSLTLDELARRLGVAWADVERLAVRHELIVIAGPRGHVAPAWQVHEGRLVSGIDRLIGAFPGGPLALALWADTPNQALGLASPAQLLVDGEVDRVVEIAASGL